jgi:superfamily II DNA or RNA helicase
LVHTTELLLQWRDRIKTFLGEDCGLIGNGKFQVKPITVGTIQTVHKRFPEITDSFGHLVIDECHRYGSHTTAYTIQEFPAKYFLGLTATPFRSDGLTKIIFAGIGPKIHKIDRQGLFETGAVLKPDIRRVPTNFRYVFANDYAAMISSLVQNDERNLLICAEIALYLQHVKESILIVTDRKNHAEIIRETLLNKYKINSSMLLGTTKKKDRVQTTEDIRSGKSKVLIATSQLISEGYDMANLSALFLTTPIKFSGKLIQACGRILRPKEGKNPLIVDFRDDYVQVLKYSGYARDKTFNKEWR